MIILSFLYMALVKTKFNKQKQGTQEDTLQNK